MDNVDNVDKYINELDTANYDEKRNLIPKISNI